MGKIIPILLALVGTGAGIGAGFFLKPEKAEVQAVSDDVVCLPAEDASLPEIAPERDAGPGVGQEYVKLNNQFVVPVMSDDRVEALVVASLSIEISAGSSELVYSAEPKLRDVFLQTLFDHANIGGFEGSFTAGDRMDILRRNLLEAARMVLGRDVKSVLITEIARQDA